MNKFKLKLMTALLGAMLLMPGIAIVSETINSMAADNEAQTTEVAFLDVGNGGARTWGNPTSSKG